MTQLRALLAALQRAARTGLAGLRAAATFIKRTLPPLLVAVFGQWQWQKPKWVTWSGSQTTRGRRYLAANPMRAAILVVVLVAIGAATYWYVNRPKPHYVTYVVTAPGLTEYNDNGISSIKPLKILFNESAAPLKSLQKAVTTGIDLSPAIAGTWFWTNDKELQFTPKDDWPVDGEFTVRLAKQGFLAAAGQLEEYRFKFSSQPFAARITESQFYQDPRDPNLKKLVATVAFSHPVDAEQFESHVSLAVAKDAEYLGLTPDSRHFTVAYDKFKLAAFIHSAALAHAARRHADDAAHRQGRARRARRQRHARSARGRRHHSGPHQPALLRRPHDRRRQRALRARADSVADELVAGGRARVRAASVGHACCRSVTRGSRRKTSEPYDWRDEERDRRRHSRRRPQPSTSSYVPSDEGGNTSHGFKFLAPVGRYLYVMVKDGVQGTGGYLSGKPFVAHRQGRPVPARADVPRPGRAAVALRRQQGRLPRRATSRRSRSRSAACCRTSCSISRRRCGTSRGRRCTADLEDKLVERFVDDPRLQRQGARQADLRQHRRRRVPAGPGARLAAGSSCCTSARGARCGRSPKTSPKASRTMTGAASRTRG